VRAGASVPPRNPLQRNEVQQTGDYFGVDLGAVERREPNFLLPSPDGFVLISFGLNLVSV